MCGICGIVNRFPEPTGPAVRRMNDAQAHRGPDGEGFFLSGEPIRLANAWSEELETPTCCALGHRRLAILDPTGGAQPMLTSDRKTAALLNGEIYNFRELREELKAEGVSFVTDTDTEVLLYLYRRAPDDPGSWLKRLNGIFALAIWDQDRRRLLLARDHFGVKPLHYARHRDRFYFSSEIKSLLAAGVPAELNRAALHVFMNIRYVPGTATLFRGIDRFPPAHFAWVEGGVFQGLEKFYDLPSGDWKTGRGDLEEEVGAQFGEAVRRQLLSDVPIGMALSGGLDSSMIVAAAYRAILDDDDLRVPDRLLRTFTLGFNEPTDENEDAEVVAKHFATRHHDTKLAADPLEKAAEVIRAVEEPKINILQGYELARFMRPHVKVLFSGLGGDELFAGYDIHRYCNTLGRLNAWTPEPLQKMLLAPAGGLLWKLQTASGRLKTEHYRIGAQIALSAGNRVQFYTRLRNAWDEDTSMFGRIYARPDDFLDTPRTASYFDPWFENDDPFLNQVLRAEFQTKMVNDFLVNEDRVTSAHGVEGRVPFLDRDLVEMAFRIPGRWKMKGRDTKILWKNSVGGVLPESILRKKKHGFTFSSYHQWIKDLRGRVERDLTREWCHDTGLFNFDFIDGLLDYTPHPNLRWHYFVAWMMLGVKTWTEVFDVRI